MPSHKLVSDKPAETPIATRKRLLKDQAFDLQPFVDRLQELLDQRNYSRRFAATQAGLDHQAMFRIMNLRYRPGMSSCILLADLLDVNPNEFLQLAGWPTLKAFSASDAPELPPDAVDVARELAQIADVHTRRKVAQALRVVLRSIHQQPLVSASIPPQAGEAAC